MQTQGSSAYEISQDTLGSSKVAGPRGTSGSGQLVHRMSNVNASGVRSIVQRPYQLLIPLMALKAKKRIRLALGLRCITIKLPRVKQYPIRRKRGVRGSTPGQPKPLRLLVDVGGLMHKHLTPNPVV